MKFEEAIDIFDNSSKLMLVTTYKRLRRLKWCEKNNFVLDTTSVEVDKDKKEISSTEQTENVVTPILLYNKRWKMC